jgi:hypothetical protein
MHNVIIDTIYPEQARQLPRNKGNVELNKGEARIAKHQFLYYVAFVGDG